MQEVTQNKTFTNRNYVICIQKYICTALKFTNPQIFQIYEYKGIYADDPQ
jgi:hypothetical protein